MRISFRNPFKKSPNHSDSNGRRGDICREGKDERDRDRFRAARAVICLRFVIILLLTVAATVCAGLTYRYVERTERKDFMHAYEESLTQLSDGFQERIDMMVGATSSFSAAFTSRFGPENSWPFVTMPDFQEQAQGLLTVSRGRALEFSPFVTESNRSDWEDYDVNNAALVKAPQEQLSRGIYMKNAQGNVVGATGNYSEARYDTVLSPVWQIAPVESNEQAFMFDLRSQKDRRRAVEDMQHFKVPTLTSILQLVQDKELRPSAILFSPIFSSFAKEEVVGSTLVVFNWDTLLRKIMPRTSKGSMTVVIETNTGQAFTFSLAGDDVTVVGEGDLHDRNYDDYQYTVEASLEKTDAWQLLNKEVIKYTLHIYPSASFEYQYKTNASVVYTVVVVMIFFATSAAFLLYDYVTKHQRNVVMRAARRSVLVVDSLFPAQVRDRMFSNSIVGQIWAGNNHTEDDFLPRDNPLCQDSSSSSSIPNETVEPPGRLKKRNSIGFDMVSRAMTETPALKMMKRFVFSSKVGGEKDFQISRESNPIADLFPSATVMFADIAGFTSWSADRDPAKVFQLLEKLFSVFDDLATQMGVYKISTIGDCYLAVAGLPDARHDHAQVMATFAMECQERFVAVTNDLSPTLGPSTAALKLRVGLHSGPVTAGVLRGLKPRFEVFGDTVNTASRMESTGEAQRIQVSQETAELLIISGRKSWVIPRKELIVAKGKGQMQTYWLSPNIYEEKASLMNVSNSEKGEQFKTTKFDPSGMDPSITSFMHHLPTGSIDMSTIVNEDTMHDDTVTHDCSVAIHSTDRGDIETAREEPSTSPNEAIESVGDCDAVNEEFPKSEGYDRTIVQSSTGNLAQAWNKSCPMSSEDKPLSRPDLTSASEPPTLHRVRSEAA